MKGKGLIRFFLALMVIVTLYQFLLVVPANWVENDAEEYAEQVASSLEGEDAEEARKAARVKYLDSMNSEVAFRIPLIKNFTYQELKRNQLALGLDLKGGMSMVLQVDLREFIETLANNSTDETFDTALKNAVAAQTEANDDLITLFADEWSEIKGDKKLSSIFSASQQMREEVNVESTDAEVIRVLRSKADETVQLTFNMLKERIDKFGVSQPNISLDEGRDMILIELPGVDNPARARSLVESAAKLEFWHALRNVDQNSIVLLRLQEADNELKRLEGDTTETEVRIDTTYALNEDGTPNTDVIERIDTIELDANQVAGPLFSILAPNPPSAQLPLEDQSPIIGYAERNNMERINEMLEREEVKRIMPSNIKLLWGYKPIEDQATGRATKTYALYAINTKNRTTAPIEGDRVVSARQDFDPQANEVQVTLRFDNRGGQVWGQMTTEAAQDSKRPIAIVLDDRVASAPRVLGPITGGNTSISGNFSVAEATDLANVLQIGKLPAKPVIVQEAIVGPTLGADNISRSINSLMIGFVIVLLFMIAYYARGGVVSIIALLANLFFVFGALASIGTVLTLPGIAGIVLTIGMAVDANVIIYERIREELREGKSMLLAIRDGFQNSYSAIIDANVTTILTAIILFYFGLGPIKGFATVLIVGVISSVFSAVLVGRLMIDWWTNDRGNNMSFSMGWSENVFSNLNIDWLGKRKITYVISGVVILAGIVSMFTRGFDLGVDFKGGYTYTVEFDQDMEASTLRNALTAKFDNSEPVVKAFDADNTYSITTDYLVNETGTEAQERVLTALYEGVNEVTSANIALEDFRDPDGSGTHVIQEQKVGATIADDIVTSSYYATIFSLIMIALYIFIRFRRIPFSVGAIVALFHDVLVTLSVFTLLHGILPFNMEIDQTFIAALLTVVGYSINDTVVVFDRIREYMGTYVGRSKEEIINMAVNSTISRTIITSLTTLFVVAILLFFGGSSIKGFAFALFVGIIVGTYSSVFVATPVVNDMTEDLQAKTTEKTKRFSKAVR